MKIIKYKSAEHGFTLIKEVEDWDSKHYIPLTEPLEVEFTALPAEELVAAEVAALDASIEAIKAEAMLKVEALQGRKQELLALGDSDEQV